MGSGLCEVLSGIGSAVILVVYVFLLSSFYIVCDIIDIFDKKT